MAVTKINDLGIETLLELDLLMNNSIREKVFEYFTINEIILDGEEKEDILKFNTSEQGSISAYEKIKNKAAQILYNMRDYTVNSDFVILFDKVQLYKKIIKKTHYLYCNVFFHCIKVYK